MIKNYIVTAFRHFWKNKLFSFINIAGLALSMAVCLLLIIIIKDANSYDKFHPNRERVFRINTEVHKKDGNVKQYASSPYILASSFASNYNDLDAWTILNSGSRSEISFNSKKLGLELKFTNSNFFKVFGFTLKDGDANSSLKEPYSLVLTKDLSDKLFPNENALGKTVQIKNAGLFKITGIMNEFPGKTHLEFDALASFETIPSLEKDSIVQQTTGNWINYYSNYTYIRLKQGISSSQAEAALTEIEGTHYKNLSLKNGDAGYRFYLQPLNKITPGPLLNNNMGKGLSSGRL